MTLTFLGALSDASHYSQSGEIVVVNNNLATLTAAGATTSATSWTLLSIAAFPTTASTSEATVSTFVGVLFALESEELGSLDRWSVSLGGRQVAFDGGDPLGVHSLLGSLEVDLLVLPASSLGEHALRVGLLLGQVVVEGHSDLLVLNFGLLLDWLLSLDLLLGLLSGLAIRLGLALGAISGLAPVASSVAILLLVSLAAASAGLPVVGVGFLAGLALVLGEAGATATGRWSVDITAGVVAIDGSTVASTATASTALSALSALAATATAVTSTATAVTSTASASLTALATAASATVATSATPASALNTSGLGAVGLELLLASGGAVILLLPNDDALVLLGSLGLLGLDLLGSGGGSLLRVREYSKSVRHSIY